MGSTVVETTPISEEERDQLVPDLGHGLHLPVPSLKRELVRWILAECESAGVKGYEHHGAAAIFIPLAEIAHVTETIRRRSPELAKILDDVVLASEAARPS